MTRCRVEKRILQRSDSVSEYTCLYYELESERAPERGGELFEGRWFSGPLTAVIWNVDEHRFKCRVADEVPAFDGVYDYTHDFLLQNALQQGWRLCTPAPPENSR